jgi:hypothetical protein
MLLNKNIYKKTVYLLTLCLMMFVLIKQSHSQIPPKATKLQAIYMYNFMLKIQWPEHKRVGDFVIGVLGNTLLLDELRDMASKRKIDTRDIVIKQIYVDSDIKSCHLIFIPSGPNSMKNLKEIRKRLGSFEGVLLVTEQEGLAEEGSVLNFILYDSKLRFEMNTEVANYYGFKTSAIGKYAILVN